MNQLVSPTFFGWGKFTIISVLSTTEWSDARGKIKVSFFLIKRWVRMRPIHPFAQLLNKIDYCI